MSSNLSQMKCVACSSSLPPLTKAEIDQLHPNIPDWEVVANEGPLRLRRTYRFKDFASALEFTNRVGRAADAEGHHPILLTEWGKVTVTWWTHKIKGLHQNDFIMAARCDEFFAG
jgi:4a-hydroxytetrahydrobiopterin dehydratase